MWVDEGNPILINQSGLRKLMREKMTRSLQMGIFINNTCVLSCDGVAAT
jgi:hypothetical protein